MGSVNHQFSTKFGTSRHMFAYAHSILAQLKKKEEAFLAFPAFKFEGHVISV